MKLTKLITAFTLLAATATLGAVENGHERKLPREKVQIERKESGVQLRKMCSLGTAILPIGENYVVAPRLGWGMRVVEGASGFDLGASFAGIVNSDHKAMFAYQAPKLTYLTFVNPKESTSLYYGLGGSWGGVHAKDSGFYGILANGSIGYEMNRDKQLRSTIHLEMGYPVLPLAKQGSYKKPLIDIAYSLGF